MEAFQKARQERRARNVVASTVLTDRSGRHRDGHRHERPDRSERRDACTRDGADRDARQRSHTHPAQEEGQRGVQDAEEGEDEVVAQAGADAAAEAAADAAADASDELYLVDEEYHEEDPEALFPGVEHGGVEAARGSVPRDDEGGEEHTSPAREVSASEREASAEG